MNPEFVMTDTYNITWLSEDECWQAVLSRDVSFDGNFVYAVRSTGIYCRPSCSSRKPRREKVLFFALPDIAEQAGFKPCKRCSPDLINPRLPQLELVRDICRYIQTHLSESLTLKALGIRFAISPSHLQRQFKSVVGISPAEYAEASRMDRVKAALRGGCPINSALYEAGFGSSSRLYSKSASQMGMTPRSYRNGGQGSEVHYTVVQCPLGLMLVAATERGICAVKFGDVEGELEQGLSSEFSQAHISRDDMAFREWVSVILRHVEGKQPHLDLPLDVRATAFQKQVWQALQAIPYGETRTYGEIAAELGMPGAARAIGHACATNPVSVIIPCHRVVRSDGGLGGYRWGLARKEALLRQEGAGREHQDGEESKASYRRR